MNLLVTNGTRTCGIRQYNARITPTIVLWRSFISIGYNAGITLTIAPWIGYIPHVESGRETAFRAVQVCLGRSCSGAEKAVNGIGSTCALLFYTHREVATAYCQAMDKAVVATGRTMYKAGQK